MKSLDQNMKSYGAEFTVFLIAITQYKLLLPGCVCVGLVTNLSCLVSSHNVLNLHLDVLNLSLLELLRCHEPPSQRRKPLTKSSEPFTSTSYKLSQGLWKESLSQVLCVVLCLVQYLGFIPCWCLQAFSSMAYSPVLWLLCIL